MTFPPRGAGEDSGREVTGENGSQDPCQRRVSTKDAVRMENLGKSAQAGGGGVWWQHPRPVAGAAVKPDLSGGMTRGGPLYYIYRD